MGWVCWVCWVRGMTAAVVALSVAWVAPGLPAPRDARNALADAPAARAWFGTRQRGLARRDGARHCGPMIGRRRRLGRGLDPAGRETGVRPSFALRGRDDGRPSSGHEQRSGERRSRSQAQCQRHHHQSGNPNSASPMTLPGLVARIRRRTRCPGGPAQLETEFIVEPMVEIVVDVHT